MLTKFAMLFSASYAFAECYFGREFLEEQYERLTGDYDDLGPQYEAFHPFGPSYIVYTPAKMIHASRMTDVDSRPSTVIPSRSESKNGSLGSKGSRSRKENGLGKKIGGDSFEKGSREKMAMSVINKISAEVEMRYRRRGLGQQDATETQNVSVDIVRSEYDATKQTHSAQRRILEDRLIASDSLIASDRLIASDSDKGSALGSYDFDKAVEDAVENAIENRVQVHTFEATKVTNKGSFKSNTEFTDQSPASTPWLNVQLIGYILSWQFCLYIWMVSIYKLL